MVCLDLKTYSIMKTWKEKKDRLHNEKIDSVEFMSDLIEKVCSKTKL